MSPNDTPLPVAPPLAPPTTRGPLPNAPTSWPKVLGIIAIVLGILGILANLWAMAAPYFAAAMLSAGASDEEAQAMADAMRQTAPIQVLAGGLLLIASVLLLVTGIGLASRRRWSVRCGVVWAAYKMVAVVVAAYIGVQVQEAVMQAVSQSDPQAARARGIISGFQGLGAVLGTLWGWAFPIFLLVWLGRRRIRDETASWR